MVELSVTRRDALFAAGAMASFAARLGQQTAAEQSDAPGHASDVEKLTNLNEAWLNAYTKRDAATLNAILAEDFAAIYPNGTTTTKAQLLARLGDSSRRTDSASFDNLHIRVFGDVAVVSARSHLTGHASDGPFNYVNAYADIYVRREGRWRAIAAHIVRVQSGNH